NHPFTLAYALFHSSFLDLWRRDYEGVLERTTAALELAEEHGYEVWRAVALVLQGTALIALGRPEEGLARGDQGIALYRELSTPPVFWPFILVIRARGYGLAGRLNDALDLVDQAVKMLGERYNLMSSEYPVLKGDLLLAASGPEEAEPWFQLALDTARQSGARTTELRAATRLTRLWQRSGRQPDGSDVLREVYESFAGMMDTPDLADARSVLAG